MLATRKKRKVSDLTTDDANALLRVLAEFQEHLDEEDEDLPKGLIVGLEELRNKLQVIPVHFCLTRLLSIDFSKVDAWTLLQVKIKSGPLLLCQDLVTEIETLGVSTRVPNRALSMEVLRELIGLVRCHVSLVVSWTCSASPSIL
jgi:hypothetical protein